MNLITTVLTAVSSSSTEFTTSTGSNTATTTSLFSPNQSLAMTNSIYNVNDFIDLNLLNIFRTKSFQSFISFQVSISNIGH